MRRWIAIGACGVVLVLAAFVGVYLDREWGEAHLFVKHRPCARLFFGSPVGEGDRAPTGPTEEADERDFRDFVEEHGGASRSIALPFSPEIPRSLRGP